MSKGAFCLVLHGHLPWVLHHGRWPHGEDWLYQAASETWLPLLQVLDTLAAEGIRPAWTVGLTPILLEQISKPEFATGFRAWLQDCRDQAERDAAEFDTWDFGHGTWLAGRYEEHYAAQRAQFDALDGELVGAFKAHALAGRIEILTSNATHGYHPLMLHDRCGRAQVRCGVATSERHLGWRPAGAWLPECAYRPPGPWVPPVVHGDTRHREGTAALYADEGVRFFFVEDRLVTTCTPWAEWRDGHLIALEHGERSGDKAWHSVLEPVRVVEGGVLTPLTVLGRCNDVAEHVWNAEMGYPGDGRYLEFHKRHGMRGLRYWRVTSRKADLGAKEPYDPAAAHDALYSHADHFASRVRDRLAGHHAGTGGRHGIVCTPFDAELFGHWWAEGPSFLLEVARRMHHDADIDVLTVGEALERIPADKAASLPEGTWGAGGDHRVWLGEHTWFVWNAQYRAEDRFIDLWHRADWERDPAVAELLSAAARQLLLLQASDWPFVVSTGGAHDYGTRRFHEHVGRFDDLCIGVEDLLAGREPPPVCAATLRYCQVADPVFPDLDLGWWA